ncbi:tetratricopeptide repeat protein [Pirellula sp. SH-Sr6A]|uniref:tetratricopeptide repeat protein n=1 Tax=Pirellula sp. SH-Sr6A TaxID=1632865 RepID=UPI00143AD22C|nr:tetratricopeptide repeat protein [Pirellula sp. SH-Sr6A]
MPNHRTNPWRLLALGALSVSIASGCKTSPGVKSSIWPTQKVGADAVTSPGVGGTLASTTKAVKGQFSSMGTAVTSAYGKAKTAITAPFSAPTTTEAAAPNSATAPLAKTGSIGPEVYVMTGQLHESKGDYAKALDSYSKALEAEPKNISALLSMARLYDRQNEKDKSISFFNKAIEVAPNNAASYSELGAIYVKSGNLNAAKEQFQKAVNLDPKNANHRSALAGVLLDMGNADGAMAELAQVHQPAMANYQMAYLHFSRKNVPATQQYLGAALQIDPNLKPARDLLASMGGGQSLQNLAQQGNQWMGQAQGVMQQASAISTNVQTLMQTPVGAAAPQAAAGQSTAGLPSAAAAATPSFALPPPPQSAQQPDASMFR